MLENKKLNPQKPIQTVTILVLNKANKIAKLLKAAMLHEK